MEAIVQCEELIRKVSRAFYPDECVVIFDILIAEKFLREDEMARRVRMSAKQVRGWLHWLMESERLVMNETLAVVGTASEKHKQIVYWYVDLGKYVDVVRYRVALLLERAQNVRPTEAVAYECRRCGTRYESLDAVRYGFRCTQRLCVGEADAILEEVAPQTHDDSGGLAAKIQAQLDVGNILDILRRLDGKQLPENRPSQNRASGLGGAAVFAQPLNGDDDDVVVQKHESSMLFSANIKGQQVEVVFEDSEDDDDDLEANSSNRKKTPQEIRDAAVSSMKPLPEFLNGSRIANSINHHQQHGSSTNGVSLDDDDEFDDVAWEDAVPDDDDDDDDDDEEVKQNGGRHHFTDNGFSATAEVRAEPAPAVFPTPVTAFSLVNPKNRPKGPSPVPNGAPAPGLGGNPPVRFTFGGGNGASKNRKTPPPPPLPRFRPSL